MQLIDSSSPHHCFLQWLDCPESEQFNAMFSWLTMVQSHNHRRKRQLPRPSQAPLWCNCMTRSSQGSGFAWIEGLWSACKLITTAKFSLLWTPSPQNAKIRKHHSLRPCKPPEIRLRRTQSHHNSIPNRMLHQVQSRQTIRSHLHIGSSSRARQPHLLVWMLPESRRPARHVQTPRKSGREVLSKRGNSRGTDKPYWSSTILLWWDKICGYTTSCDDKWELINTEDGEVSEKLVMGRGSIEVDVYRVSPLQPMKRIKYNRSREQVAIPEKAKKALITHSIVYTTSCWLALKGMSSYGDETIMHKIGKPRELIWLDPYHTPLHTFIFQYRSRGMNFFYRIV